MKSLLHRLTLRQKLALISGSFVLPIVVMLSLIVSGQNANIAFATSERAGADYLRPLVILLQAVPEHGAVSRRAQAGDEAARG